MNHECQCCSNCQYELTTLRTKYEYLVMDYPKLRQKMILASQTQQMYKQENMHLNTCRIQQQSKIRFLQNQLKRYQNQQHQFINSKDRKDISHIDELSKTINSKNLNGKIIKQDLERKKQQLTLLKKENQIIRRQNWELNNCINSMSHRIAFLQNNQNQVILQKSKILEDTKISKNSYLKTEGNLQDNHKQLRPYLILKNSINKRDCSQSKLGQNEIEMKIRQLQYENSCLRKKLISKV